MGTVSVPSSTLCLILGCFLDRKRLEPKELLWQHHWGCHFFLLWCTFMVPSFKNPAFIHHWSNLHNRKTSISLKRKQIFQKEKRHSSVFWKAFQISGKYFSCHIGPLNLIVTVYVKQEENISLKEAKPETWYVSLVLAFYVQAICTIYSCPLLHFRP